MTDLLLIEDNLSALGYGLGRRVYSTSHAAVASMKTFFYGRKTTVGQGFDPNTDNHVMFLATGSNPPSWSEGFVEMLAEGNIFRANSGWMENWTPDLDGEDIYLVWMEDEFGGLPPDQHFRVGTFNTASQTMATDNLQNNFTLNADDTQVGVCSMNDGKKFAFYHSVEKEEFRLFWEFAPGDWLNVVTLTGTTATVAGVLLDECHHIEMVPAAEDGTSPVFFVRRVTPSGNDEGIYVGVWDMQANGEIVMTQPRITELMTTEDLAGTEPRLHPTFSVCIHPFNGKHYVLYIPHEPGHADHALKLLSIDGPTEPPVALSEIPISNDNTSCNLTIDQHTGNIYASWISGDWPNNVQIVWTFSVNGGADWDPILASSALTSELHALRAPHGFAHSGLVSALFFAWHDEDTDEWRSSNDDDIIVGQYTVDEDTPGNEVANCPIGQEMGGSGFGGDFLPHGYPQYIGELGTVYLTITATKRGSLVAGDKILGVRSRATGIFQGWSGAAQERIKITSARPGPYGVPFLPGEDIVKYNPDPSTTVTVANSPLATAQSSVVADADT